MKATRFVRSFGNRFESIYSAHVRQFTSSTQKNISNQSLHSINGTPSGDVQKRLSLIKEQKDLRACYPRLVKQERAWTRLENVLSQAEKLVPGASDHGRLINIYGRVKTIRVLSSKLIFIVLENDGRSLQVVWKRQLSENADSVEIEQYMSSERAFKKIARRGDWLSVVGHIHKTTSGEPSLLAQGLPEIACPSLHDIPLKLDDQDLMARKPHLKMLMNPSKVHILRIRSEIESFICSWFRDRGHYRVNTPLLSSQAGGAVARPFETSSTEFSDTKLNLRIAPELWLKRLIIGGLDKIYELGPAFRNEGVDATHNPEFTMCEAYSAFTTLDELQTMTNDLIRSLHVHLKSLPSLLSDMIPSLDLPSEIKSYPFIPTLESRLSHPLPSLDTPTALSDLLSLFKSIPLSLPENITIPSLLDALASQYIEPLSANSAIYITEIPAALCPLAKSYKCPTTGQEISARAELFINQVEYANMYEEENDPFLQREKFVLQNRYRAEYRRLCNADYKDGDGDGVVDESYLEALEWGLPPTGGWGLGVDRLVMLMTGQKRIADVLPFGSLRNVVGLQNRM